MFAPCVSHLHHPCLIECRILEGFYLGTLWMDGVGDSVICMYIYIYVMCVVCMCSSCFLMLVVW